MPGCFYGANMADSRGALIPEASVGAGKVPVRREPPEPGAERGKPRTSGWISRGRERSSCTGGALHPQVTQLGKLIPTAPCEPPCQHRNRGSRSGGVNPRAEAVMLPEAPEEDLLRMNSSQFSGSLFRRSPVEALPSLKISAVVHLVPLVLLVWGWPSAFSVVSPAGGWMASPMWKGSRTPRGLWPPASSPVSPSPSGWHSRRELSLGCCRHRPTSCLGSRGGLVDGGKAPPEARGRSEAHCGGRLEPKPELFREEGPSGGRLAVGAEAVKGKAGSAGGPPRSGIEPAIPSAGRRVGNVDVELTVGGDGRVQHARSSLPRIRRAGRLALGRRRYASRRGPIRSCKVVFRRLVPPSPPEQCGWETQRSDDARVSMMGALVHGRDDAGGFVSSRMG